MITKIKSIKQNKNQKKLGFRMAQVNLLQDILAIEICLNYIQTTIRIFRNGNYLSIFIRAPNRLLYSVRISS